LGRKKHIRPDFINDASLLYGYGQMHAVLVVSGQMAGHLQGASKGGFGKGYIYRKGSDELVIFPVADN
jgi:hypothetical protein